MADSHRYRGDTVAPDRGAPMREASERARSRMEALTSGKFHKVEVHYKGAKANKGNPEHCGVCEHGRFIAGSAEGSCKIVAGGINYLAICNRYSEDPEDRTESPAEERAETPAHEAAEKTK